MYFTSLFTLGIKKARKIRKIEAAKNSEKVQYEYYLKLKEKSMLKKFIESLKRWNWTIFFACLAIGVLGGIQNDSTPDFKTGLIFGLFMGSLIGIILAFVTKEEN